MPFPPTFSSSFKLLPPLLPPPILLSLFPPFLQVKVFYESTVRDLPSMRGQIPEYPRWFLPCTRRWLQVYQKEAISFVDNAWDDDRDNLQVRRVPFH